MSEKAKKPAGNEVATGVFVEQTAKTITITVLIDPNPQLSGSGKSKILGSTRGNVALNDGIKLGLNIYKPA